MTRGNITAATPGRPSGVPPREGRGGTGSARRQVAWHDGRVRFPDPDHAGHPAEGATRRDASRAGAARGASRRGVLRGAGAVALATATGGLVAPALAGCTPAGGTVDVPGAAALAEVITGTADLADRYDAAILACPDLAARLTPLRDPHRTHARGLAGMLGQAPPPAKAQQPPTG